MQEATMQEATVASMRKVDKMLLDLVCASTNEDEHKLIADVKLQHEKTHGALKIKEVPEEIFLTAAKMGKTSLMEYLVSSIGVIGGVRPTVLYKLISQQYPTDVIDVAERFARKPSAEVLLFCVGQETTDSFDFAMERYPYLKPGIGAFKKTLSISDNERFDLWYKKLLPFFQGKKGFVVDEMCVMFGLARGHVLERLNILHRDGFSFKIDDLKNYANRYVRPEDPLQDFVKTLVQKRAKERAAATRAIKAGAMPLQKSIVKKSIVGSST